MTRGGSVNAEKSVNIFYDGEISIAGLHERKTERAKIGEKVRFMYNPENSHSPYWMQGELEKRIDKYGTSRKSGFTWNRFTVKNLTIINSWDITSRVHYRKNW